MGWWSAVICWLFVSKSWIQNKSCNPDRTDGSDCTDSNPGFPRCLNRFTEVTTASLRMSRDLGLKGRARSWLETTVSKQERFQIKGTSTYKNRKKNIAQKSRLRNCQSMTPKSKLRQTHELGTFAGRWNHPVKTRGEDVSGLQRLDGFHCPAHWLWGVPVEETLESLPWSHYL